MPKFAKRSTALAHRPNPLKGKLSKATERLNALQRRARAGFAEQEESAIAIGAPLLLGVLEGRGTRLPSVFGIDPAIVWGGALAVAGMKFMKGKNGRRLTAAGVGLLSSAARDSAKRGSIKVGEDEEVGAEEYDDSL